MHETNKNQAVLPVELGFIGEISVDRAKIGRAAASAVKNASIPEMALFKRFLKFRRARPSERLLDDEKYDNPARERQIGFCWFRFPSLLQLQL
jgi:hypothetical protein